MEFDLQSSEQSAFVGEQVEPLIIKVVEAHLKDKPYDEKFVTNWVNFINEDVILALSELGKPFKYIVHCSIMQNTGAGIHASVAEHCDGVNDGVCVVKWPTEKSKDQVTMCCIVTVFGLAFFT